jgi:hypothetical protein
MDGSGNDIGSVSSGRDIAIVGIGCRFPGGAEGPDAFWDLLIRGVDAITEVLPDRWPAYAHHDPRIGIPGRSYSRWGGFINGIDLFCNVIDPANGRVAMLWSRLVAVPLLTLGCAILLVGRIAWRMDGRVSAR